RCRGCTAASARGCRRRASSARAEARSAKRMTRRASRLTRTRARYTSRFSVMSIVMSAQGITAKQKARILAEALPFIRGYHAKTLIVRLGGAAMANPVLKDGFARDVALLRLVGMNPIVVHGGGWRIDDLLKQMGIPARRERGI